ncbi:TKL protein kinase [Saprolegnia diclina VS20]|uniref:TKL protein kinase n=1 Tax=Saprolegnia diclina (strain VS20) TaxID=1156394 RepID=T0R5G5_SAPDV|nr:TKL protein kinase [Saprolegnia diclina VS20]EQC42181.1 TKL protein kinase [Saprolegnia diclina VS20]|eukprot:XP_008604750.1 TKL protein kinase [Saprolegnia diclina VS20]
MECAVIGPPVVVAVPTFTTECASADCRQATAGNFTPGAMASCVWLPDGRVVRGANLTTIDPTAPAMYQAQAGVVKNVLAGGVRVEYVRDLPNSVQGIVLADLGLTGVSNSLRTDRNGTPLAVTSLSFSGNALRRFDATVPEALLSLDLSYNALEYVNIAQGYHPKLQDLDLAGNALTNERLLNAMTYPNTLTTLALGLNALRAFPVQVLQKLPVLQTLLLNSNPLGSLPPSVAWPPLLVQLSLRNTSLTVLEASFPSTLRFLDLQTNANLQAIYANASQLALLRNTTVRLPLLLELPHYRCNESRVLRTEYIEHTTNGRTQSFPICVVADTIVPAIKPVINVGTWIGAIAAVALVALGIIVYLVWRSRAQAKRQAELLQQNASLLASSAANKPQWYEESGDAAAYYHVVESARLTYDVRFDDYLAPYRITVKDLDRHVVIARGGFGVVYYGTLRGTTPVAMKRMLPHFIDSADAIEEFMNEIRLYAHLSHPKIVQFIGITWTTLYNISMVTEFMPFGDVWSLLEANGKNRSWHERLQRDPILAAKASLGTPSTAPNSNSATTELPTVDDRRGHTGPPSVPAIAAGVSRLSILTDVVDAMVYLHSFPTPVIHRDIKARNVLLGPHYEAKLTDFGTSRLRVDELTMTAEIGTSAWIAPEVLKGVRYTEKADMYSFGVMMTELDTVQVPYAKVYMEPGCTLALARARIAMLVASGDLVPEFTAECPPGIVAIGMQCLAHNPDDRPSATDVAKLLQQYHLRQLLGTN